MRTPSYEQLRSALEARITEAADVWFTRASQNPSVRLYLYFVPAMDSELCGKLFVAAGSTGGMEQLATPESVPRNLNRRSVRAWISERTQRLPILNPNYVAGRVFRGRM